MQSIFCSVLNNRRRILLFAGRRWDGDEKTQDILFGSRVFKDTVGILKTQSEAETILLPEELCHSSLQGAMYIHAVPKGVIG